ncbi:Hypothetical predicted protein [Lecanosticta acicola]|uniref:Cytochrome b561 domain-containing protein n=1 Tax=Lecanosticta acicola TaxID=111012 RepID=A0AAI9E6G9_9PEZI|nr:Hypothetical predicted protein [Lecanosticta acicola]
MSANGGLSPAGTSTYDSSTMYVGDGTWDSERNTFLLPNLQGLNFATMQYNGMGNRFRDLPQYHVLITGHGVIAAITFLGLLPAAIFIARFFHVQGRWALKLHVYLQILTVFLATVVLVLGWFAVGPERSLSNPHHGIGVAIYVCILVQFLYGWWWARVERKRTRPHPTIPLKVHIHRLFGRAIALLAFVQIALGLTLYGSPKALFILYALWGALLLCAYLTLEYRNKPRIGTGPPRSAARSDYYSDYSGSYVTGDQTELTQDGRRRDRSRSRSHWGRDILAGAGALGAYEWWKDRRERRLDEKESRYEEMERRRQRRSGTPGPPPGPPPGPLDSSVASRPPPPGTPGPAYGPSGSVPPPAAYNPAPRPHSRGSHRSRRHDETVLSPQSWEGDSEDEKYANRPPRTSGNWRDRILGAGAGIAAFEGVKSLFGSKKRRDDEYVGSQTSLSRPSQTDVSRVEAGQAPFSPYDARRNPRTNAPPMTPTRPPNRRRPSVDSMSYDDETSYVNPPPRQDTGEGHTLRDSIATMGAIAGFREWNRRRRDRREQERLDRIRQQELDNEEQLYNRRNSNRYPRPQDAHGGRPSMSDTILTGPTQDPTMGSNPELSRTQFRPDTTHPPLPAAAGTIPSGSGAPPSTVRPNVTQQPGMQQAQVPYNLPPPPPGPPPHASRPGDYPQPAFGSAQMPQGAVEPDPSRLVSEHQASQQTQQDSSGLYRDGTAAAATEAAAAAAGVAAAGVAASQRTQSQSPSRRRDSRSRMRRSERRGSSAAAASGSQVQSGTGIGSTGSPPVSVKVNMHPDGRHVTLRRLNEEEAAAERSARRRERRSRRASSLSSGAEEPGRYRRTGGIRDSSQQPIKNIPPPPAMSNSGVGRPPSELNLPPALPQGMQQSHQQAGWVPGPSIPTQGGLLPPAAGPAGSGAVGGGVTGSPPANVAGAGTDMGTGTDVSAFDSNRRRRRAERARRAQAASGQKGVEFE